jgi:hypothetical protein
MMAPPRTLRPASSYKYAVVCTHIVLAQGREAKTKSMITDVTTAILLSCTTGFGLLRSNDCGINLLAVLPPNAGRRRAVTATLTRANADN